MSVRLILKALGNVGTVGIGNLNLDDSTTQPANAGVTLTYKSDGSILAEYLNKANDDLGFWIAPQAGMGGFSIRATINSGTVTSGTTGSWLPLTSDQAWSKTRVIDSAGTSVVELTIEIARTADTGTVLDSAIVEMIAAT
jgi:hypothetical protein